MEATAADYLRKLNIVIDRSICLQVRIGRILLRAVEKRRRLLRSLELEHMPDHVFVPTDSLDQELAEPTDVSAPTMRYADDWKSDDAFVIPSTYDCDPRRYMALLDRELAAPTDEQIAAMAHAEVNDRIAAWELAQTHDLARWLDDGGAQHAEAA